MRPLETSHNCCIDRLWNFRGRGYEPANADRLPLRARLQQPRDLLVDQKRLHQRRPAFPDFLREIFVAEIPRARPIRVAQRVETLLVLDDCGDSLDFW